MECSAALQPLVEGIIKLGAGGIMGLLFFLLYALERWQSAKTFAQMASINKASTESIRKLLRSEKTDE